ncbi:hypothetical protein [Acidithiobacillus sp.]|uniref:hypothetical protein n=1 Tax=Acidithiobacillus sp. TaxID=1872118 RepID=UPI003D067671
MQTVLVMVVVMKALGYGQESGYVKTECCYAAHHNQLFFFHSLGVYSRTQP